MYLGQVTGLFEHEHREGDGVHVGQRLGEAFVIADETAAARGPGDGSLNGLIANDKFCLTRLIRLRLSWPRARVGPRVSVASQAPGEATHCGEAHETAAARMARPAQQRGGGHGPAALGPGLPTSPAVGGHNPARAAGAGTPDPAGGTPCERVAWRRLVALPGGSA